jgi:hypothetical protein
LKLHSEYARNSLIPWPHPKKGEEENKKERKNIV